MDSRKVKSLAITIRPKGGVTDTQILAYSNWARTKSQYSYTVTEKEFEQRHIHSALFFEEPVRHDNIKRSLHGVFPLLSEVEKRVAIKVKVVYSHDWLSYLDKGDSTVVVYSNLPEKHMLEAYFSSPPPVASSKTKTTEQSFYSKLERMWYQRVDAGTECNPRTVRDFLFDLMYSERLIDPLRDDRTIVQVSRHLHRYINKYTSSCIEVNPLFEKDE